MSPDTTSRRHGALSRRGLRLLAAIVIVLTSSCGGGDDDNDAATSADASATSVASDDPAPSPDASSTSVVTDDAATSTAATSTPAVTEVATTAPSGDGCDLVSDEVAAEVLGVEIVRREAHGEPGSQGVSCIKGLERTGDPAGFFYVSVAVVPGGSVLIDEASAQEGSQPVDGLGDRAVYVPNIGALYVAEGADAIQVQVVKAGVPGSQQDAVTVANDVFERRS